MTPIDLVHLGAGAPLAVGTPAEALALADDGRTAWIGGENGTLVSLNLASGALGAAVTVGGQPSAVVIPAPPRPRTAPGAGS